MLQRDLSLPLSHQGGVIGSFRRFAVCILFLLSLVLGSAAPIPAASASQGDGGDFTLQDVKEILEAELIARELGDQLQVRNLIFYTLRLPQGVTMSDYITKTGTQPDGRFLLSTLDVADEGGRFQALLVPQNSMGKTVKVSGRFEEVVELPTLGRTLHRGDIIGELDIRWVRIPAKRLRPGTVIEENAMIGKQLKRLVSVGKPINERDLTEPTIVYKGDLVNIIYRRPYMKLRTQGFAQTDAAAGDVIALKNSRSGVVIQARIQPSGEALVNYDDALFETADHQYATEEQG